MRLACTSLAAGLVVDQIPTVALLRLLALQCPNHHPQALFSAQLVLSWVSLSLSGVLNFCPLDVKFGNAAAAIASPASPLYSATVSRYLLTSSLMENVEYSAEYHRPEVRWIYSQTHATSDGVSQCHTAHTGGSLVRASDL